MIGPDTAAADLPAGLAVDADLFVVALTAARRSLSRDAPVGSSPGEVARCAAAAAVAALVAVEERAERGQR